MNRVTRLRNLIIVLGDQLDERSAAFDGFDPATDAVWMAEVAHESEKVWVSKPHIAIFLAAMRKFRWSFGPTACPFTTLYGDFLLRHEAALARNPRIVMQVRHLQRFSTERKAAIRQQAAKVREDCPVAKSAAQFMLVHDGACRYRTPDSQRQFLILNSPSRREADKPRT